MYRSVYNLIKTRATIDEILIYLSSQKKPIRQEILYLLSSSLYLSSPNFSNILKDFFDSKALLHKCKVINKFISSANSIQYNWKEISNILELFYFLPIEYIDQKMKNWIFENKLSIMRYCYYRMLHQDYLNCIMGCQLLFFIDKQDIANTDIKNLICYISKIHTDNEQILSHCELTSRIWKEYE